MKEGVRVQIDLPPEKTTLKKLGLRGWWPHSFSTRESGEEYVFYNYNTIKFPIAWSKKSNIKIHQINMCLMGAKGCFFFLGSSKNWGIVFPSLLCVDVGVAVHQWDRLCVGGISRNWLVLQQELFNFWSVQSTRVLRNLFRQSVRLGTIHLVRTQNFPEN